MAGRKTKELSVVENVPLQRPAPVSLISEQAALIMDAMNGEIPEWAKQTRPGRGGKAFTYISHGYVTDELNRVFGPFWNWKLLPGANGEYHTITTYEEDGKEVKEVTTVGELTIRVYDAMGRLLETIVRHGEGGKVWERKTTLADAKQSSSSDALKRAAFRLGKRFGLQLYWDDEERQEQYLAQFKPFVPERPPELWKALEDLGISDEEFLGAVGLEVSDLSGKQEIREAWEKLMASKASH